MTFPAFLDACVLMPINVTDVLLRLAKLHAFRPMWSAGVLDEIARNLPRARNNIGADRAARRVSAMRRAFPEAEIADYEWLVPTLTNDPKDRHVLAAAIHGGAEVIVTANLRDFLPRDLRVHGIVAAHPDDFLLDLLDDRPELVTRCLHETVSARRRPPETVDSFLIQLAKVVPRFAEEAQRVPPPRRP